MLDDELFFRNMECCNFCGIMFCTPVIIETEDINGYIFVCPAPGCGAPESDFQFVSKGMMWTEFMALMGRTFTEDERMQLRNLTEASMLPSHKTDGSKWEQG